MMYAEIAIIGIIFFLFLYKYVMKIEPFLADIGFIGLGFVIVYYGQTSWIPVGIIIIFFSVTMLLFDAIRMIKWKTDN